MFSFQFILTEYYVTYYHPSSTDCRNVYKSQLGIIPKTIVVKIL